MSAPTDDFVSWNEAHARLSRYLETFALRDRVLVTRLGLQLLDEALEIHRASPTVDPIVVTMRHTQSRLRQWLAANLGAADESPSHLLAGGYIALLLSDLARTQPAAFLAPALPEPVRQSLRQTLLQTGPDLTVSSMTPRHLDYGPMLGLARQTWHRWDTKAFATALLFWVGIYGICYWCLAEYL